MNMNRTIVVLRPDLKPFTFLTKVSYESNHRGIETPRKKDFRSSLKQI